MINISLIVALLAAASMGFQVEASKRDFIIAELIHGDSYLSQLINSLKSTTPTSSGMTTKSNTLLDGFNNFDSSSIHDIDARDIESEVTLEGGAYHMKISTNGQEKHLLLMTTLASTLIFGDPCDGCHDQDAPRFPPSLANKENFPVDSTECRLLRSYREVLPSDKCGYLREESGLNTHGVLSRVTSFFGSSSAIGTEGGQFNLWFSRVYKSERDPLGPSVEGLVGLGPGPYSLITQLAGQLKIAQKFSYCLINPFTESSTTNSKIIFGDKKSISTGKVTTPFVTHYAKPFYYLSLRAIMISNQSNKMKMILMEGHDIIAISSHIKTTQLPPQTYNDLVENIKSFMVDVGGVLVSHETYSLCYNHSIDEYMLPKITLEFDNGEILNLPRRNTYITINSFDQPKLCMTIEPTKQGDFPMLGTHAQQHFQVEYDLDNSEISFALANCYAFGI